MSDKGSSFFDGFFLGSFIGGALAVLFTPFTGEEARSKVKDKFEELKDVPAETAGAVKENSQEVIAKTIDSIEEGILRLTQAVEEAKKATEEKRKELGEE